MNVILIIFDSLRKDCIEYFGNPSWGKVYTPNLSRFAEESFVLNRCYPESLPTIPARRALYTGERVYPFRNEKHFKGDFLGAPGWGPIEEQNTTISEMLKLAGYTTALFSDIQHQFKPLRNFHRGFDEWHWIRGYEFDANRTGPNPKKEELEYWLPKIILNKDKIYGIWLSQAIKNMYQIENEEDYFVAQIMRNAVSWLEQNQDKEKIFLIIESWSPHEPWFVPKHFRNIYTKGKELPQQVLSLYDDISYFSEEVMESTQANYSGLVTMCDKWFGYFINSLKYLNLLENTLVIVTSDHGHSIGENNYLGKRGYPSSLEVFDIPLFIRYPSQKYGKGIVSNILVQYTDITATILDIIGIKPRKIDIYSSEELLYTNKKIEDFPEAKLHGESFFSSLLEKNTKFRDHVTIGWGSYVTVITDKWWFNSKVNGKGAFLYNLNSNNPFSHNITDSYKKVAKEMYKIAVNDANGNIPEFLINQAINDKDAPGCSNLAIK